MMQELPSPKGFYESKLLAFPFVRWHLLCAGLPQARKKRESRGTEELMGQGTGEPGFTILCSVALNKFHSSLSLGFFVWR